LARDSAILAWLVRRIAAISVLLIGAVLPQAAAAQDDGVFFDPGGPSTKEYAVPHERAREGGGPPSGGSGGASPGGGSEARDGGSGGDDTKGAPLFGAGVSRSTGNGNESGRARARGRRQGPSRGGAESVVGTSPAATETNPATGLGWLGLISLGVVLSGGGLAYLVRRRGRGPTA
jgi:hypothetical protein